MKLCAPDMPLAHCRRHRHTVVSTGQHMCRVGGYKGITVNKIKICTIGNAVKEDFVLLMLDDVVPAHMRYAQLATQRLQMFNTALNQVEPNCAVG